MAYSINDKTVLRAGYGKYFLNPTSQGNNAGFSLSDAGDRVDSTAAARRPTALSNPWPNGIQTPPGSSLGPQTFLGRGPNFSNPDFVVPNVHQFSAGVQRELPWRISLEATYAGSRSYDLEAGFNAFNEPSAEFQRQCDVTQGGSRTFCDQLLPNPFFGVAGFEGTTRFTNPTLSRFELNRPFPAFGGITRNQNNVGKLIYDSAQFVANKRWAKGVTINASYTYVPRWTEIGGYVDAVSGLLNEHRVLLAPPAPLHGVRRVGTAVVPRQAQRAGLPARRLVDRAGGRLPERPAVGHARQRRPGAGHRPQGDGAGRARRKGSSSTASSRASASVQREHRRQYDLASVSTAYGCTEPYFLIRQQNYQRRTAMNRYDEFRRPGYFNIDMNFAKTTPITNSVRLQVRFEAFNLLNSPQYDERQYNQDPNSADFGRINRN